MEGLWYRIEERCQRGERGEGRKIGAVKRAK
jgi:hypothetical protein